MRPVDLQPLVSQQTNSGGAAQQAATGSQVSQQAFAAAMQRAGERRPAQVQAAPAGSESRTIRNPGEEQGERRPRPKRPRAAAPAPAEPAAPAADPSPPRRVDVSV